LALPIGMVGTIYAGEVLLLVWLLLFLPASLQRIKRWPRYLKVTAFALVLLLFGYMISDLLARTATDDLLRGWAKVTFMGVDVFGLVVVVSTSHRRLLALAFGYASAGLVAGVPVLAQGEFSSAWKTSVGYPVSVGIIALLSITPRLPRGLVGLLLFGLGIFHILVDFRSVGVMCVVIGCVTVSTSLPRGRWPLRGGLANALMVILGVLAITYALQRSDGFSKRREAADVWRLAALEVSARAITESPLVGHGSWASSAELLDSVRSARRDRGSTMGFDTENFQAHSQILQMWFEGGLLALMFPVTLGCVLTKGLWAVWRHLRKGRGQVSLTSFWLVIAACNLLFSPFNGYHRIDIALAVAATVVMTVQARRPVLFLHKAGRGCLTGTGASSALPL